jgi:hypothetical protein
MKGHGTKFGRKKEAAVVACWQRTVIIQAHSEGGARHQDRRVALDVQECYVALSSTATRGLIRELPYRRVSVSGLYATRPLADCAKSALGRSLRIMMREAKYGASEGFHQL